MSLQADPSDPSTALIANAQTEIQGGNLIAALDLLTQAQQTNPQNPHSWQLATALTTSLRDWPALRHIARNWTHHQPASVAAWKTLSRGCFEDSLFQEAIDAFKPVLELEPGNVSHLVAAARLATAAQNTELAHTWLTDAETINPHSAEVLYARARLYQLQGELTLAETCCKRVIQHQPGYVPAYTALGLLTEGRLDDTVVQAVAALAQAPGLHPEYQAMLGFTLGDALDCRGDYDQAFAAWQRANNINAGISQQEGFRYHREQHEADMLLLEQIFDGSLPDPAVGPATVQPVFVTGMPRSGTTLVESILASHTDVHGGGELNALTEIYEQLMVIARRDGAAAARGLLRTQAGAWRERYLQRLPHAPGKARIVDKQPLNFRAIGLIRYLFPEATVIYTRRDPMDVGLSIFRHNFSKNWPCAHNLGDIGHYYRQHTRIMAHWLLLFPAGVHVIDHSTLVNNLSTEVQRLLTFAGLGFQQACLTPHKTRRAVATFSTVQIRRPVSAQYSGRAANYTRQLAPLHASLAGQTQ